MSCRTCAARYEAAATKWRDLRTQAQNAEVQQYDSFPSYGSLLVDAERILDELERAEYFLAASTP